MVRQSLKSTAQQVWVRIIATLGIAAAVVTTWWMKVEDARAPDAPPTITFGEPVKVGRSVFTPQKLVVVADSNNGERQLVLSGTLENMTASSQRAMFGTPETLPIPTSGDTVFSSPRVTLVRDNYFLKQLEPRVREEITIAWKVPSDWQEQDVSITFSAQRFKLKDNLYAKSSWLGFYPTGILKARPEQGA